MNQRQLTRYEGTYFLIPKVHWDTLRKVNFNAPNWNDLYALKSNGSPNGQLTPRLAAKLFSDSLFILDSTELNMKFLQDRLPECIHKIYKKKRWRMQLIEAGRRITCRLARGLHLSANCLGEDMYIYVLVNYATELGWNRSREEWKNLPESDKDRDVSRLIRLACSDDIASLYREPTLTLGISNFKDWFRILNKSAEFLTNHLIHVEGDLTEDIIEIDTTEETGEIEVETLKSESKDEK